MDKERRDKNGLSEEEFLQGYQAKDYERPSVAADMVIFTVTDENEDNYRKLPEKELRVLLIQRGGHPYLGAYALPGGFVRPSETTEKAAARELLEETGVRDVYLEQLYTFSEPGRDPRTWVMSCSYMALIDSTKVILSAGDDADNAAWFRVVCRLKEEKTVKSKEEQIRIQRYELKLTHGEESLSAVIEKRWKRTERGSSTEYDIIENDGLAFDHARILFYALERLRGKLEYTDLALHLMPELFTLTQLQQVYEVILNKPLLKAAFRRKIANLVEETGSYTSSAGHRPSQLYRRRWEDIDG